MLSSEVADFATSKVMGLDDMNRDSCIISLSWFRLGKCFAIEFSKQETVAKAVVKVEEKKKQRIRGRLGSKKDTVTVPWQRR